MLFFCMAFFRIVKEYQVHCLVKMLRLHPVRSPFLEVGSGKGDFLKLLHSMGLKGKGIDLSAEAARYLEQLRLNGIRTEHKDVFEETDRYRFILMIDVLEHIEDDERCLRKLAGLLEKDGLLVFVVPSHRKKYCWIDRFYGHFRRYDRSDILAVLGSAGLEPVELWCSGTPFIAIMENLVGFFGNIFFKDKEPGKAEQQMMSTRTAKSGIISPVAEKIGFTDFMFNRLFYIRPILGLIFRFMDLFLKGNAGCIWFVACRKKTDVIFPVDSHKQ